jgi:hypothetical protein
MSAAPRRPRVSPRLPLPASVYVYNGFYNNLQQQSRPTNFYHRPDPTAELLHAICLELVVNEGQEEESAKQKERILYSKVVSTGTIQPVWHHLNETIDTEDLSVEEYESMTLRFYLLDHKGEYTDIAAAAAPSIHERPAESLPAVLWQQFAIHPSKLARMGLIPEPHKHKLPFNFMLVQYTDKSLRILPSHYHLLSESGAADLINVSKNKDKHQTGSNNANDTHSTEDSFGRFEDTVFRTLDQVSPAVQQKEADDLPLAQRSSSTNGAEEVQKEEEDAAFHQRWLSVQQQQRRQALQDQILAEERALQVETQASQEQSSRLQALQELVVIRQRQTLQVKSAIDSERQRGQETEFRLQAQEIRLVRELQAVFPITLVVAGEQQRYSIRGLGLPSTTSDSLFTASEEDLSAALGYLCHLIHMLSKYLAIQLRYRLMCHNSRSGIQDDRAILYPLFLQSRTAAERDQFEHGILLLHRNVECLLRDRDICVSPKLHILGKVKRLYEHVVEGY